MTSLFETNDGEDQTVTFDSLVGEGKKYRDPDAVAKAVLEKDRFIEQLKAENATAREELRSRTNLEEIVNQLKAGRTPQPNTETPPTQRQDPVVEPQPSEDLDVKLRKLLEAEKSKDNKLRNIETATNGLKERFGADYKQTLSSIVNELGVSQEFIDDLAATSPSGFLKLVDSVKAPDDRRPVAPPVNRAPTPNTHTGRRNKAYYDEIRRTNINEYLSPKVQQQLYKDAMEQGENFYK